MEHRVSWTELIIALLVAVALSAGSALGAFSSINAFGLQLATAIAAPARAVIEAVDALGGLLAQLQQIQGENIELRGRVASLESQLAEQQVLEEQNSWLLKQLNVEIPHKEKRQALKVAKYEQAPLTGYLYLYKGDSSLAVGDFVADYNYVVGRVVEIIGDYAKVELIVAERSELTVSIGQSTELGTLYGESGLGMLVRGVRPDSQVAVGDKVSLWGYSAPELADYHLGEVVAITGVAADGSSTLEITTPVDLYSLEFLIVIPDRLGQ